MVATVPGAMTVGAFSERLREAKVFDRLFEQFHLANAVQEGRAQRPMDRGYELCGATAVVRYPGGESDDQGRGDIARWHAPCGNASAKGLDSRRTKRSNEVRYGYKTPVSDNRNTTRMIEQRATAAHVHDSQAVF